METKSRRTFLVAAGAALSLSSTALAKPLKGDERTSGVWRAGTPLPFAVQEIYPALHNGQIHLAGGFVSDGASISGASDRHIAMAPETGTWFEVSRLPTPRHHPNLISFNGQLLSIGGFETEGPEAVWVMQAGVWSFDGVRWRDSRALPQPNGESVCEVLANRLHVCGGRQPKTHANSNWQDHTDVADHFVLDDVDGSWSTAAPLPEARNSAAGAQIHGAWHVVGGRTVADGNSNRHDVYDPKEDRWRAAAPLPQAQGGLAAASLGSVLYAFGGEYFDNGGGVYSEAYAYNPRKDGWDRLPDMPNPRHGLGAVAIEDAIYLMGGALEAGGNQTTPIVDIFQP